MNQTRYNPNVTAGWNGDDGAGGGDGDDDDPDEVQLDGPPWLRSDSPSGFLRHLVK